MTAYLQQAIHALASLPAHIVAAIPVAAFVALCLVCMVPSITARLRSDR